MRLWEIDTFDGYQEQVINCHGLRVHKTNDYQSTSPLVMNTFHKQYSIGNSNMTQICQF